MLEFEQFSQKVRTESYTRMVRCYYLQYLQSLLTLSLWDERRFLRLVRLLLALNQTYLSDTLPLVVALHWARFVIEHTTYLFFYILFYSLYSASGVENIFSTSNSPCGHHIWLFWTPHVDTTKKCLEPTFSIPRLCALNRGETTVHLTLDDGRNM